MFCKNRSMSSTATRFWSSTDEQLLLCNSSGAESDDSDRLGDARMRMTFVISFLNRGGIVWA